VTQETRSFVGDIDDFALFNHALTSDEADRVYYGMPFDSSEPYPPVTTMAPIQYPSWSEDFHQAFLLGMRL
jgi:hypothetical protein